MGEWDVDAMLQCMPLRLFNEWLEYSRLEPWDENRADLRAGIVASVIANVHRGKTQKPYRPKDFMPVYEKPKAQTAEQMRRTMMQFAAVQNRRVNG